MILLAISFFILFNPMLFNQGAREAVLPPASPGPRREPDERPTAAWPVLYMEVSSSAPLATPIAEPEPIPGGTTLKEPETQRQGDEIDRSLTTELSGTHPRRLVSAPLTGRPVAGKTTQGFGCSPYYSGIPGPGCPAGARWFHDGVDIGAYPGVPVRSAMAGTVLFAGPDGSGPVCAGGYRGYGLSVVLEGGEGWQALYAHLSRIDVTAGQVIDPETIVGTAGATGCVSGAHLHFGLRRNGKLVDPRQHIEE